VEKQKKEFLAEAEEILGSMEGDIMRLARGVSADIIDHSVLNRIFRSVHTLKGLSSLFDLSDITDLSHALEDKLDMLRLGRIVFDNNCLSAITMAHGLLSRIVNERAYTCFSDEVRSLISTLKENSEKKPALAGTSLEEDLPASLLEYENFRLQDSLKAGKRLFLVSASFETSSFDKEYNAFTGILCDIGEIIATLPASESEAGKLAFEALVATSGTPEEIESRLCRRGGSRLRELFCKKCGAVSNVGAESALSSAARKASNVESMRRNARTIRVDVEKIESLMSCVDELCRLKGTFNRLREGLGDEKTYAASLEELKKFETRLEDSFDCMREYVLAVKMVRIGRLFKRFEPYIERLAYERGVEVYVTTYGDDTELDMTIIEEIADPLMHIIRNVMDHAIEPPDARAACGKSRKGAITLSAYYEGEKVVIEVKDDGSGIDADLISARAVSKGFTTNVEAASMGRREKLDLLFLPGFTTSDKISLTCGRGVGLDVVRENIALLNGIVEIETVCGKGTRFILTIPVSQVMKGLLMCEDGGKTFAVSGTRVAEVVAFRESVSISDGYIIIDDIKMRAIRPSDLFYSDIIRPNITSMAKASCAIITSVGSARLCLVVDKVLNETNMIIRPLPFEHKISGILGLSEAADNQAVLVLDIAGILELLSSDDGDPSLHRRIV